MFGSLSMWEILFILVIALIIFGPRKLPQLGRTLGESLAQFRRASEDFKRSWEQEITLEEKRLNSPTPASISPSPTNQPATGGDNLESVQQTSPGTLSPVDEPITVSEADIEEKSGANT